MPRRSLPTLSRAPDIGATDEGDAEVGEALGELCRRPVHFPTEPLDRLPNGCLRIGGQYGGKLYLDHGEAIHREVLSGFGKCGIRQAQFDEPRQGCRDALDTAALGATLDDGLRSDTVIFNRGPNPRHPRVEVPWQLAIARFGHTRRPTSLASPPGFHEEKYRYAAKANRAATLASASVNLPRNLNFERACQSVGQVEDRDATLLLDNLDGDVGHSARDAVLEQHFGE